LGGWAPAERLGAVDLGIGSGRFLVDVAAGPAGDALYVEGAKWGPVPTMRFSARLRAPGAAGYGDASTLHVGMPGEIRAAPLTGGRFLVLMRSGSGLQSRAGSPTSGFGDPLVFSGTDAAQLLGLAGATSGLAVAAWVTTTGAIHAAVYDDSAEPTAGRDTVAPVLSRLSVSPRRFVVRRRTRTAARIRWRLSEPARVTLHVDRARPGFRRGGRCVARRPRTSRIRRCTRFARVGSFTRTRQAGRATVRSNGFVNGRRLRPGRHRLTAIPRDAAGNRGKARRTAFRVRRHG
jgi:hypothetical protein